MTADADLATDDTREDDTPHTGGGKGFGGSPVPYAASGGAGSNQGPHPGRRRMLEALSEELPDRAVSTGTTEEVKNGGMGVKESAAAR